MDGNCFACKELFEMGKNVYTEAGVRETRISGMCEKCFDTICAEEENPYPGADGDPDNYKD